MSEAGGYGIRREPQGPVQVPAGRYTDEEFARLERERLWPRVWQLACVEEQVAEPGDWIEYRVGEDSYVIVRGKDAELRAFHNVCSHRGFRICEGSGNSSELRCGFHHWRYDLDGTLRGVSLGRQFGPLDRKALGLKPVRVQTWGRLVFLNPSPEGPELEEFLGEMPGQLAAFELDAVSCESTLSIPVEGNWKTTVDAFNEIYHAQGIHPQMDAMLDDVNTSYRCWPGGHSMMCIPFGVASPRLGPEVTEREVLDSYFLNYGAMIGKRPGDEIPLEPGTRPRDYLIERIRRRAKERGLDYSRFDDSQVIDDWHFVAFPNLVFNVHADFYTVFRARPGAHPNTSFFDFWMFRRLAPDHPRAFAAPPHQELEGGTRITEVLDQDLDGIARVQAGLRSSGLDALVFGNLEQRLTHLHGELDRWLGTGEGRV